MNFSDLRNTKLLFSTAPSTKVLSKLDGTQHNPVTQEEWGQLIFDLDKTSHSLINREKVRKIVGQETIPISFVDLPYTLVDSEGKQPIKKRVTGCCGMLPFRVENFMPLPYRHAGLTVNFFVHPELCFTDYEFDADLEIDFQDGSGWKKLAQGDTATICYTAAGNYTIHVRWWREGDVQLAAFTLNVTAPSAPEPNLIWALTGIYQGNQYRGTANVWLGNGLSSIEEAVVFAQPFSDITLLEYYDELNEDGAVSQMLSGPNPKSLILIGYDYQSPIQVNAMLVMAGINQLLAATGSSQRHFYGGVSMGALVMRYALTYWENKNLTPALANARAMFSWDGPNFCACLPVSVQWQMLYWSDDSDTAEQLVKVLHSPAAKQMLFYNVSSVDGGVIQVQDFKEFWDELWNLGGYPQNIYKIGVANGSGKGGHVLDHGKLNVTVIGKYDSIILTTSYSSNDPNYSGSKKTLAKCWRICSKPPSTLVGKYIFPFTDAPGGLRDSFEVLANALISGFLESGLINKTSHKIKEGNHSFVPTFSALDMPNVKDPYENLEKQESNFNAFKFSSVNTGHTVITSELQSWFLQTMFGTIPKDLSNHKIKRPQILHAENIPMLEIFRDPNEPPERETDFG
jgi:hypothetical protein